MAKAKVDPVSIIEGMNGAFDDNFLELARALRDLNDTDFDTFSATIQKHNIKPRKAYYLVEMDKAFRPLNVDLNRLRKIGWTKLSIIAPVVNKGNVDEMLLKAETLKSKDLTDFVRGKAPANNAHAITLYFSPEEYKAFQAALLENGGEKAGRGVTNKEQALLEIIKKSRA